MSTKESKSYNVLPGLRMGVVTPDYLETLAAAARKHRVPFIKLTSAQRFAIAGHPPEALRGFRLFGVAALNRLLGRELPLPEDNA